MREILFRGKRVDNGDWVYGAYCDLSDKQKKQPHIISYSEDDEFGDWIEIKGETVGQFTGLCDKNGKKIFEDDILQSINDKSLIKRVVVYNTYKCSFEIQVYTDLCGCHYNESYMTEELNSDRVCYIVIGNIHDNSEFFEK